MFHSIKVSYAKRVINLIRNTGENKHIVVLRSHINVIQYTLFVAVTMAVRGFGILL